MDGTLLDPSHHLTEENLQSLLKYQKIGGTVAIATGKLYHSIKDLCHKLKLKTPQIIDNGYALVSPDGKLLECMGYLSHSQRETASSIFDDAELDYVFYGTENIWYEEGQVKKSDIDKLVALGEVEPQPLPASEIRKLDKATKLLAFCEDCDAEESVARATSQHDDLWSYRSSPLFIEIALAGIDKGYGLKKLLERLDIHVSETIVVGDSENDLPMFELAGLAVAMGQAPDNVKAKANIVTAPNDESGVAKFLQEHVFSRM